jgi:hypothetical protein
MFNLYHALSELSYLETMAVYFINSQDWFDNDNENKLSYHLLTLCRNVNYKPSWM